MNCNTTHYRANSSSVPGDPTAFADKNVGSGKAVSVVGISISGADAGNYNLLNTTASTTANITARTLVVSATGTNKVYDGNTTATVTLSDDRVSGDVFTDSYTSATFANKNVGTAKPVSVVGISISGTDAGNYTANATATTTANITARTLVISATGINKVYDGTTAATVTLSDDRVAGDVFSDSYTSAAFNNKNVGTGKAVSVSGISISGTDAGNYTFNTTASTTADITARALTISATGVNKVYDGTTAASVTLSDNRVSGDSLTTSYASATFADKNVGTGKAVSVSGINISGTDAGNYTFNTTASTTANITARALVVSATGVNKVYDGNTSATVTLSDNRVSGDSLTTTYTSASFATKTVANGKTVSVTGISISGTDAGNYTFNTTASTTADITPRDLTVSATGINKVYDGNTAATVSLSTNKVAGDYVTPAYTSASFADKNVATGKTVSVTGISISGTDAGNYNLLNTTASTTANITARALVVSATGVNKVYDGTTTASVTLSDNRVAGDVFTDSYTSATFANKNVGTAKPVSVVGISISGTDASNYTANTTANTSANITARVLTVSATGINKVYDGNAAATVTLSDNRVSGDVFNDSYTSAAFNNKNVGTGKAVSVVGISISGTDASNYTFNTTASTTANITARALVVSATGVNKVYDGNTTATVTLSDDRVSGDVFSDSYTSATFADKNVANNKTVSVSGISISGTDAGNYTANATATTAANITKAPLTIEPSPKTPSRQYTDPNPSFSPSYSGFVPGETAATALTTAPTCSTSATPTSAIGPYAITCSGAAAANYSFIYIPGSLTVTQEDAKVDYTGDPIGLTGNPGLTLRATVWDSAAAGSGFSGDTTIGDITRMYIQFDVYSATSCGTGTPTSLTAQVSDTGTLGDGIGTATATFASSQEATYCVVVKLIGNLSPNTVNTWYSATPAVAAVITFYTNTGQFVTGGGWIPDQPNSGVGNGHGNFGFNARFNKSGSPQGQMVYVYRGLYNGVQADFRIKSNSLTSLGFACWNGTAYASCPPGNTTFPARATLSGKATIQINRASDGYVLLSDGNATFSATVVDSGQSSGIGADTFSVTVYDKNAVLYKQIGVPSAPYLSGGNVVIHGTAN